MCCGFKGAILQYTGDSLDAVKVLPYLRSDTLLAASLVETWLPTQFRK
jgi:hypothetical protein